MAESSTSVCNQALARVSSRRINDFNDASNTKQEAVLCRLFFDQTRRALLKDHYWPFAKDRVALSKDTEWDVDADDDFQYTYAYHLPSDFIRVVLHWNNSNHPDGRTAYSYELEGKRLLTSEGSVFLKYIKDVTDIGAWDIFFIEMMVLLLASKLVIPLSQELDIKTDIDKELVFKLKKVRAMDRQEEQVIGRSEQRTWNDARVRDTV